MTSTTAPAKRNTPTGKRPDLRQLRRLFGYTRPYRWQLLVGIISVAVASGLGFVFPALAGQLFNTAFAAEAGGFDPSSLNQIFYVLIAIFVLQGVFNFLRVYNLALVGEGVVADLRKHLYQHLLGLSNRFFESRRTGEITSRLTSDITTVQNAVSQALAQFINQSITLVGGIIYLFILNLQLTLVMLSIIPAVILAGAYFGRKLRKISMQFQDKVADANASAEEAISGIRVVKSFTAEALEAKRYGAQIDASYRLALRRALVRALFIPSIIMAMFSGIGVVLWFGSRLVFAGQLPGGDLITFLLLTVFVAGSIGSFTGLYSQLQEALGASRRIFELLDTASDLPQAAAPKVLIGALGRVQFDNVAFRYGDRGDALVLKGVTLEANPGEVVALVGPSGAGKSTLISLIPRFYDPTEGVIRVDGIDIRELSIPSLRATIGIVPQETQLFSGTIAENILYGRPDATAAEVEAAAKAANAHDFIMSFPESYATIVGEKGIKLSGGQRQRIAIARAVLKNPRILILDEATSSLDSESEALVQAALDQLMQGRTTFVIAHRLSTVQNADKIIVLDEGRVVEQGAHEVLLAKRGLYAQLYTLQFKDAGAALAKAQ